LVYLDRASREFFTDWERAADEIAAVLGSEQANPIGGASGTARSTLKGI